MQDMSLGQLAVLGRGRGGWCSELSSGVGLEIWEGDVSPETLWEPLMTFGGHQREAAEGRREGRVEEGSVERRREGGSLMGRRPHGGLSHLIRCPQQGSQGLPSVSSWTRPCC